MDERAIKAPPRVGVGFDVSINPTLRIKFGVNALVINYRNLWEER